MTIFNYKARDTKGKQVTGSMEASSAEVLADKLSHLGYFVSNIKEEKTATVLIDDLLIPLTKIKTEEMVMLSNQLATMIGAGVSLPNRYS